MTHHQITVPDKSLRILQISDCHVYTDPKQDLAGVRTLETLEQVVDLAIDHSPDVDLVLATGDIAHDATERAYLQAKEAFQLLPAPVHYLPGNHDDPALMRQLLDGADHSTDSFRVLGNWLIILLDSTLPGNPGGHMSDKELGILEQCLQAHPDHHALVCLHHHPIPVGSLWVDRISLDNPEAFLSIIDRHDNVRGVLWGHIHQEYDEMRGQVRMVGSPSTCIQFTPKQDQFALDTTAPGFRWLDLLPNGEIRTGVTRLADLPMELNLASTGY